jgi:hypothetical protein
VGGDMAEVNFHLRAGGFIEPFLADLSNEKRHCFRPAKKERSWVFRRRPILLVRMRLRRGTRPKYPTRHCKSFPLLRSTPFFQPADKLQHQVPQPVRVARHSSLIFYPPLHKFRGCLPLRISLSRISFSSTARFQRSGRDFLNWVSRIISSSSSIALWRLSALVSGSESGAASK